MKRWFLDVCVIGAGAAGIAVAKILREHGYSFHVKERESGVGGIWDDDRAFSPHHKNLHLISPNRMMSYEGDEFESDTPDFAGFRYVKNYFEGVVAKYDLARSLQFNTGVARIYKSDNQWHVECDNGTTDSYRYVVIASGLQSRPSLPQFDNDGSVELIHCVDYNEPKQLLDRNLVVTGGGQSAIDITKDGVIAAKSVVHSMRQRPYWFPKYNAKGKPSEYDYFLTPVPLWVKNIGMKMLIKKVQDMPAFGELPVRERVMNAVIDQNHLEHYERKDIIVKPGITRIQQGRVHFTNNSSVDADIVVAATGYETEFGFIDRSYLHMADGDKFPNFVAHTVHPSDHTLFTCGIVHPMGGHWPTYEQQAHLISAAIELADHKNWHALNEIKSAPDRNCNALKMYMLRPNYPVVEKLTYHKHLQSLVKQMKSAVQESTTAPGSEAGSRAA